MTLTRVVVDVAGGESGGAGRFRSQLQQHLSADPRPDVALLGEDRRLSAPWLLQRERLAGGAHRVVSANNVSFCLAGQERWTMLRNANHFLGPAEWERSAALLPRTFPLQVRQVRAAARRSDVLIAPSTSMAQRVSDVLPKLAGRVVVRLHPLSIDITRQQDLVVPPTLLLPVVPSPFKGLNEHLLLLGSALDAQPLPTELRVVATIPPASAPQALVLDPRFHFVGVLPREELARHYARAAAVYYPTAIESFGYPLAECRSAGIPVIAQETAHNIEIAGGALCGFSSGNASSLAAAVHRALEVDLAPDPAPFDRHSYFDWLLGAAA